MSSELLLNIRICIWLVCSWVCSYFQLKTLWVWRVWVWWVTGSWNDGTSFFGFYFSIGQKEQTALLKQFRETGPGPRKKNPDGSRFSTKALTPDDGHRAVYVLVQTSPWFYPLASLASRGVMLGCFLFPTQGLPSDGCSGTLWQDLVSNCQ